MEDHPLPIFVISDHTDAQTAFQALSKGALEIIPKADIYPEKAKVVLARIKLLARTDVTNHAKIKPAISPKREIIKTPPSPETIKRGFDKVIAIACSTGGPKALSIILSAIPADFPYPILVAQHMAQGFVAGMVKWMNKACHIEVKEGTWGDALAPGLAYISPVDKHMTVDGNGKLTFVHHVESDIFHPSCNKLLASAGSAFEEKTVGIILTGMGDDGVEGLKVIKEKGGVNLAQDEGTCAIFGMPKVAIQAGCIDQVLPLQKISSYLTTLANSSV